MDYFSRKPDFPTFEDIYIACAQGAIGLERREDGLTCRFGQDGPAIMLPQVASQGDGVRGRAVCDGIAGALKEDPGVRAAAAGENVIEAFDGSPVHMSAPVEVDGERVWTCGYDFCWGETVAPDFSRARGHFPDATVAAWAAARSVNESDGYLGIKERM